MSAQKRLARTGFRAALAAGVLATLVACGDGGGADEGATTVRDDSRLGRILVDAGGRTLYFADQETDGTIRCVDDCLDFWFPATGEPAGVDGMDVLRRSDDGTTQLTYDGKPLYTFQLDKTPGDAKGNSVEDDFGGTHFVWHVVTLGDSAPAPAPNPGDGY